MKNLYLLLLLSVASVNAQNIVFTDPDLKAKLLSASLDIQIAYGVDDNPIVIDVDSDGEITQAEALAVYGIDLQSSSINDLGGLENFTNIEFLDMRNNPLTDISLLQQLPNLAAITFGQVITMPTMNISDWPALQFFQLIESTVQNLIISNVPTLTSIDIHSTPLLSLELAGIPNLSHFTCSDTLLLEIDLSPYPLMELVVVTHNSQLVSLNIKNGSIESPTAVNIQADPNLQYICVDEPQIPAIQYFVDMHDYNAVVSSYCTVTPGGTFYQITGTNIMNFNDGDCDGSDPIFPYMKFNTTNGSQTGTFIANATGSYTMAVQAGNISITPWLENPSYFFVNPDVAFFNFPSDPSPAMQSFCVLPTGNFKDLEVVLIPLGNAAPGFNADYKIIYKNKGNQVQAGSVTLTYDDTKMDFVSSIPTMMLTPGMMTFNFSNLEPFGTWEIAFTMNLNSATDTPPVNIGDQLEFTAVINPIPGDVVPFDNTFNFDQIANGSFDPNDMTCLEGEVVSPSYIGEYVHYLVRFENTGTAPAQNVVIVDMIDTAKFNVESMVVMNSSDPVYTRITNGNKVEFIFENINLPFEDANNDGYVMFKIRTLPSLAIGDVFTNAASIYFDFNFPIVTNTASTVIQSLGTSEVYFADHFSLFPNPTENVLNILASTGASIESISIYNLLGQKLMDAGNQNFVDVSLLNSGLYLISITSDKGISSSKFIKQ